VRDGHADPGRQGCRRGRAVGLIFGLDGTQMCLAQDQDPVEYLAAQGADEAFADSVYVGSPDGGPQDPVSELSKVVSNEAVKFDPRSQIRS
jgi:hypothetical protein